MAAGLLNDLSRRTYLSVFLGLVGVSLFTVVALFSLAPSGFPPHIACWRGSPGLVVTHLLGDLLVGAACTVIPVLFLYLMVVGRVDDSSVVTFPALLGWGLLLVWCDGQTHLLDALEIWWQVQWARGVVKVLAGVVSWVFIGMILSQRRRLLAVARAIYRATQEEEASAS